MSVNQPEPPKPEMHKMLCLSTSHLRAETSQAWLAQIEKSPFSAPASSTPYGYFMYAYDEPEAFPPAEQLPPEVVAACKFARKHGCEYIMYDCDVGEIDELEVFEW